MGGLVESALVVVEFCSREVGVGGNGGAFGRRGGGAFGAGAGFL